MVSDFYETILEVAACIFCMQIIAAMPYIFIPYSVKNARINVFVHTNMNMGEKGGVRGTKTFFIFGTFVFSCMYKSL